MAGCKVDDGICAASLAASRIRMHEVYVMHFCNAEK